ncbi:MAG: metallophosphoesterase [Candidatus Moranbacteria bacterium]|nr:metallophosphoesterase [Candidatus Moranbacteria bacterium]
MSKKRFIVGGLMIAVMVGILFIVFNDKENSWEISEKGEVAKRTELKIGYITDLHCYSKLNSDTNNWEVNWRCSQPMNNFTKMVNEEFQSDLVIEGGDLVDGRDDQEKALYPAVLKFFDEIKVPSYHILGNHETRGFLKSDWLEFTGYKKPYYYVDVREYRLIILDGNNKPADNDQSLATSPDLHYYPGHLDQEQRVWLEKTLQGSDDKTILVFVHQPPLERTLLKSFKELFVEGTELRKLFSQHGVKAVFSGHIEEMCYIEDGGVSYYVLEGVHKNNRQLLSEDDYKDKGVFHEITITENGEVIVKMFFKDKEDEEYNTLIVNSETAICNNQSIQSPEKYKALVSDQEFEDELEEELGGEE